MPKAARYADLCSGHGCYEPRISIQGSNNVFINARPAHRLGDGWNYHSCVAGTHAGVTAQGSPNVFVNSQELARVGDLVSCGSIVATGSNDVFVNG